MIDKETQKNIERVAEIVLFAPVGIAMMLKDMAPTFVQMMVSRGHAEVDRKQTEAEERLTTARSTGEVAIAFGLPMVKQSVSDAFQRITANARSVAPPAEKSPTEGTVTDLSAKRIAATTRIPGFSASEPEVATDLAEKRRRSTAADRLPIKGYDELAASHVVERLPGLTRADLLSVHEYEAAHRSRRTILAKIEQLTGS